MKKIVLKLLPVIILGVFLAAIQFLFLGAIMSIFTPNHMLLEYDVHGNYLSESKIALRKMNNGLQNILSYVGIFCIYLFENIFYSSIVKRYAESVTKKNSALAEEMDKSMEKYSNKSHTLGGIAIPVLVGCIVIKIILNVLY